MKMKVDAIIDATGFDTPFLPHFPINWHQLHVLSERWKENASFYLSPPMPKFPNFFVVGRPNSATSGDFPNIFQVDH
jgi:cation diffusion facilitator CzcD-associated flavoprotein CzcO